MKKEILLHPYSLYDESIGKLMSCLDKLSGTGVEAIHFNILAGTQAFAEIAGFENNLKKLLDFFDKKHISYAVLQHLYGFEEYLHSRIDASCLYVTITPFPRMVAATAAFVGYKGDVITFGDVRKIENLKSRIDTFITRPKSVLRVLGCNSVNNGFAFGESYSFEVKGKSFSEQINREDVLCESDYYFVCKSSVCDDCVLKIFNGPIPQYIFDKLGVMMELNCLSNILLPQGWVYNSNGAKVGCVYQKVCGEAFSDVSDSKLSVETLKKFISLVIGVQGLGMVPSNVLSNTVLDDDGEVWFYADESIAYNVYPAFDKKTLPMIPDKFNVNDFLCSSGEVFYTVFSKISDLYNAGAIADSDDAEGLSNASLAKIVELVDFEVPVSLERLLLSLNNCKKKVPDVADVPSDESDETQACEETAFSESEEQNECASDEGSSELTETDEGTPMESEEQDEVAPVASEEPKTKKFGVKATVEQQNTEEDSTSDDSTDEKQEIEEDSDEGADEKQKVEKAEGNALSGNIVDKTVIETQQEKAFFNKLACWILHFFRLEGKVEPDDLPKYFKQQLFGYKARKVVSVLLLIILSIVVLLIAISQI